VATVARLEPADQGAARPDRTVVCVLCARPRPPARVPLVPGAAALPAAVAQAHDGLLRCAARDRAPRRLPGMRLERAGRAAARSAAREELEAAAGPPVVEITGERRGAGRSCRGLRRLEAVLHRVPGTPWPSWTSTTSCSRRASGPTSRPSSCWPRRPAARTARRRRACSSRPAAHHEVLGAVLHADPGRLAGGVGPRRALPRRAGRSLRCGGAGGIGWIRPWRWPAPPTAATSSRPRRRRARRGTGHGAPTVGRARIEVDRRV
jgi:hypothetical protein